jgi:hypothetical protein
MPYRNIYITDLDFDYKLWKNKLQYYQNELAIYDHRLEEIKANPGNKILETEIRSFQNSLHHMQHQAHKIDSAIRNSEDEIACFIKDYPISQQHEHFKDHDHIRREMNSLEVHMKALKDDLYNEMKDQLMF